MFDVLFKNAAIITMQGKDTVLKNAYCGVSGDVITYLGENAPADTSAHRTIDCKSNILMPGLINCHTHVAMTALRGISDDCTLNDWLFNHVFPAEGRMTEQIALSAFSLGMAEMLASGTTTFCDMYAYSDKAALLADKAGMRAFMSNGIIALSPDYSFEDDRSVKELRAMLADKTLSSRITPQVSIHCERTSPPEVWEKAVAIGHEYNLSMHIHLSEPYEDQENCVKEYGKTPARRLYEHGVFSLPTIAAHCVHITGDDMDLLAETGVTAVHNPVSNLKLASGIADIVRMRSHGMNVALGTDGCASNNTLDMFEEIKLAAMLAKTKTGDPSAFTAYDALCLATVNGAKALGASDRIGMIKEGMQADIILIDTHKPHRVPVYDPISSTVYCLGGSDVYLTMVAGHVLYENGAFATIDVERAMKETEQAVPVLLG